MSRCVKLVKMTAIFLMFSLSSCIHHNLKAPVVGVTNFESNFQFTSKDFEVVGNVEAKGEYENYLGLVVTGGNGYKALYQEAKKMGADTIINYAFDVESTGYLLFVYTKSSWTATATAIKWKK